MRGAATHRIFLLSPASMAGRRARALLDDAGGLPLARALHRGEGVPLGEVFAFTSSLYFRGKRAYADVFATPPRDTPGAWVITTDRGLVPAGERVRIDDLRAMAEGSIDPADPGYAEPLREGAARLLDRVGASLDPVLLGSIATDKYRGPLIDVLGRRLRFPAEFVGRGDMSRGGLLLRRAEEGRELEYVVAEGAEVTGSRPPKLTPRRGGTSREVGEG